jgi:hypothetical protein
MQAKVKEALARRLERARAAKPLIDYRDDPVGFVKTVLGEHLWSTQRRIAEAVRDHRRVAVPSCHDAGKSFLAARIAAWWISTAVPGDAFVVTSAPTEAQVKAILWREINKAHKKGRLPGKVNLTEWYLGNEVVAIGRKPASGDMTGFQGIHAKRVLVIFDEACGIPKPLWEGADSLITNDDSHILAIGNPDDPASHFAKVCKPGSGWEVIPIDALETPNFTGEEIPTYLSSLLISKTWVAEKALDWGEASPIYQAKVRGKFSETSVDGLIKGSKLREAVERGAARLADNLPLIHPVELGVDVAGGGDETVIYARCGRLAWLVEAFREPDAMRMVGRIVEAARRLKATKIKIDAAAMGWGPADRLKEIKASDPDPEIRKLFAKIEISAVLVGLPPKSAQAKARFLNKKAEFYWGLRDRIEAGELDLVPDALTQQQLMDLRYFNNSRGLLQMESKDDMFKRGLSSPDRAEALMLAFSTDDISGLLDFYKSESDAQKLSQDALRLADAIAREVTNG